jgi:hypothetical protein
VGQKKGSVTTRAIRKSLVSQPNYWDQTRSVEMEFKLESETIYSALDPTLAEMVMVIAHNLGVPTNALVNRWLKEKLLQQVLGLGMNRESLLNDVTRQMWPDTLAELRRRFQKLAKQWKKETAFTSSQVEKATNPSYQQIIGMGPWAVPLILEELARRPDHWFWALKAITSNDPAREEDRGDLDKMTRAWLRWAEEKGWRPAKPTRAKARRTTAK